MSSTHDEDLPKASVYAETMPGDCKTLFEAFIKTRKSQDKLGAGFGYWTETQDKET